MEFIIHRDTHDAALGQCEPFRIARPIHASERVISDADILIQNGVANHSAFSDAHAIHQDTAFDAGAFFHNDARAKN